MVVGATLFPHPALAEELRLASLAPQESPWGRELLAMAAEIEAATQGAVKLKLFLGGRLGDELKVATRLDQGIDGAIFTGRGLGAVLPAARILELPFLCESYAEADKARAVAFPALAEAFAARTEVVLVAPGEAGLLYLYSTKPIADANALRTARTWAWSGDSLAQQALESLGPKPTPLDVLAVGAALKAKTLDVVYNTPLGAVALGWTGEVDHVLARPLGYATGGVVLTKRAWAKIPEALRPTVQAIAQRYAEKIIAQSRAENDAVFSRLTAAGGGLKKVPITDAKYQELKKSAMQHWGELAKGLGAEDLLEPLRRVLQK